MKISSLIIVLFYFHNENQSYLWLTSLFSNLSHTTAIHESLFSDMCGTVRYPRLTICDPNFQIGCRTIHFIPKPPPPPMRSGLPPEIFLNPKVRQKIAKNGQKNGPPLRFLVDAPCPPLWRYPRPPQPQAPMGMYVSHQKAPLIYLSLPDYRLMPWKCTDLRL